ncbi:MAG: hypothetical protein LC650_04810 [Actinobacteria bacterium]|nr:hypothetical protein [Actinomycetota bacterium]
MGSQDRRHVALLLDVRSELYSTTPDMQVSITVSAREISNGFAPIQNKLSVLRDSLGVPSSTGMFLVEFDERPGRPPIVAAQGNLLDHIVVRNEHLQDTLMSNLIVLLVSNFHDSSDGYALLQRSLCPSRKRSASQAFGNVQTLPRKHVCRPDSRDLLLGHSAREPLDLHLSPPNSPVRWGLPSPPSSPGFLAPMSPPASPRRDETNPPPPPIAPLQFGYSPMGVCYPKLPPLSVNTNPLPTSNDEQMCDENQAETSIPSSSVSVSSVSSSSVSSENDSDDGEADD